MSDRLEFYFRQQVTEKELNLAFDQLEAADHSIAADLGVYGIIAGAVPTPHAPVADLTLDLTAPARAYDHLGQRIFYGTGQRVDCSRDSQGIPTEVTAEGRERWLGIFLRFARRPSDPRIDGESKQVFFRHDEACEFVVRQGVEAPAGGASFVPLEDGELLVCDVRRVGGQRQILSQHIDTRRRQVFVFAQGDAVAIDPRLWRLLTPGRANVQATFDALDAELAGHVGGATRRHNADHIEFAPQGFLEGNTIGTAIRELVLALSAAAGGAGPGAARVGMDALTGTPYAIQAGNVRGHLAALLGVLNDHVGAAAGAHSASAIAAQPFEFVQARTVQGQLRELVAALRSTGGGLGAAQIGSDEIAGSPKELPVGTLHDQLGTLLGHINTLLGELASSDFAKPGAERIGNSAFNVGGREVAAGTVRAQLEGVLGQVLAHAGSGDHDARYLSATYARAEVFAQGEEKTFTDVPGWPVLYTFDTAAVGPDGHPANPIHLSGPVLLGVQAQLWKSDSGYALHVKNATGSETVITVRGYT